MKRRTVLKGIGIGAVGTTLVGAGSSPATAAECQSTDGDGISTDCGSDDGDDYEVVCSCNCVDRDGDPCDETYDLYWEIDWEKRRYSDGSVSWFATNKTCGQTYDCSLETCDPRCSC